MKRLTYPVIPAKAGIYWVLQTSAISQIFKQIMPVGISLLYQINFPLTLPVFYLLFPRYSGFCGFMCFMINQRFNIVFFGKSVAHAFFVLAYSSY